MMADLLKYGVLGLGAIVLILASRNLRNATIGTYVFMGFGIVILVLSAYLDRSRVNWACIERAVTKLDDASEGRKRVSDGVTTLRVSLGASNTGNAEQNADRIEAAARMIETKLSEFSTQVQKCR